VIWATVPADSAIFIGYTVGRTDYLYEVAYGFAPGQYVDTLALRNVGVLKLPHLPNEEPVYYRLRRRMQWGFASEWTDERVAVPGATRQETARIRGWLQQGDEAILLYEPLAQVEGYVLRMKTSGGKREAVISHPQAGFFHLNWTAAKPNEGKWRLVPESAH